MTIHPKRYSQEISIKTLISFLAEIAGPFNPITHPDYFEMINSGDEANAINNYFLERYKRFISQNEPFLVGLLIKLLISPPSQEEYCPPALDQDAFNYHLCELLGQYKRTAHAKKIVNETGNALPSVTNKVLIFDAFAYLGHEDSIMFLQKELAENPSDEEMIAIINALGEIGGEEAKKLINEIQALNIAIENQDVKNELKAALFNLSS